MREDTNIKGADTESDFWLIIYSVTRVSKGAFTWTEFGLDLDWIRIHLIEVD